MIIRSRLVPETPRRPPDFGLAQVNIVLLLVLFFLVVGTIVETDELSVELPETVDLPLERLPRPLLLLATDGTWSLDGTKGSPVQITQRLMAYPDDPKNVHILTARDLPADKLLAAMQVLQPTGLGVTLVTLKGDTGP
ncbi:biopolymer transporter ExbD [Actibacterium sp. 188UL27-1]|uniref:biopolymer transporter ExbD n=1 Tax=Actibacterium sp. 188UL27-1 TaxID=2786961 RepID=UPI00195CEB5D|nr:biopolymer transporter ExbD [Actibacterium sp. 188UL27-1]MBM7068843.1 biopolymer transporter ExbD [Actibacterium sp. 188UL27-1]